MIDIRGVSVSFGDTTVLEDVSATIDEGRFVGLVGPNGAGKTTLLRTISGALAPDRGTVSVDGVAVQDCSSRESSRLVSVVPQNTSLSFAFDVRDVVEMGRHPYRSRFSPPNRDDREAVERALVRTQIEHLADRSIDEVSGGERQRVILARAVAQDTPVVLLDEPTSNLDVNHQIETLELVTELVADGKTVVAAIHDLDLAARYCDELALVAEGSIVDRGSPDSVLTPARIESAFDTAAAVGVNPVTGTRTVTALSRTTGRALPGRVHVVGHGSTATTVLANLKTAGVECSFGPIPRDDAAAITARRLGADLVDVLPYAPLSDDDLRSLRIAIDDASVLVLADLHVAPGNRRILDCVTDVPTVVVETHPFDARNAAGKRIADRYETVRADAVCADPDTVLDAVSTARTSARSR